MVHSPVLPGVLYTHHVPDALDHADGAVVPGLVRADGAAVPVRNHHAGLAIAHIISQAVYGRGEVMYVVRRLAQKVQSQAQSAAGAHSREGADGFHSVFQQLGWITVSQLPGLSVRTEHVHDLVDVHLLHLLAGRLEILARIEVLRMLGEMLADGGSHGEA